MLITINLMRVMESKFPKIKSIKIIQTGGRRRCFRLWIMSKELFIKIVNFITPWVGIVLCVVLLLNIITILLLLVLSIAQTNWITVSKEFDNPWSWWSRNLYQLIFSTLVAIVIRDYNAAFLFHFCFLFLLWLICWGANLNPSVKKSV